MRIFKGGALGCAVVAVLLHATLALADDCQLRQVASLSVANTGSTFSVASVELQGHSERLLIDTGVRVNVLADRVAHDLGLATTTIVASPELMYQTETLVDEEHDSKLKLDNKDFGAVQFLISHREKLNSTFDGVLGSRFLSNYDLDLNLAERRIGLFTKDHCPGQAVYWAKEYLEQPIRVEKDGVITFDAELDGKPVVALLDTAASTTVLGPHALNRLFQGLPLDPPLSGTPPVEIDGRSLRLPSHTFQILSLAGLTIRNPTIYLAVNEWDAYTFLPAHHMTANTAPPDIVIGMNYLRQLHIYISMSERKLYLTTATPS